MEYTMTTADVNLLYDEIRPLPCASGPCQNGGTCTNSGTTFTCSCPAKYTGNDCGTLITCAEAVGQNSEIIQIDRKNPYTAGDVVNFVCLSGYQYQSGSTQLTCNSDTTWNGDPLQCVTCPTLEPVANSNITKSSPNVYVTYACDVGYEYDRASGPLTRICYQQGNTLMWSNSPPVCRAVQCPVPSSGTNAAIVSGAKSQYFINDTITYACDAGYQPATPLSRICQSDQENLVWSGQAPVCIEITCNYPGDVAHATLVGTQKTAYSVNETIEFRCTAPALQTSGDAVRTCTTKGWTGVPPVCQDQCDTITCKNGGTCVANDPGQNRTCLCLPGYTGKVCETDINECTNNSTLCGDHLCNNLPGSFECVCGVGFTGTYPTCTDIDECSPTDPCGTQATCKNTNGGYECVCNAGYQKPSPEAKECEDIKECDDPASCNSTTSTCRELEGSYRCNCNYRYKQGADDKTCVAKTCSRVDASFATVDPDRATYEVFDSATYTCNPGYKASGSAIIFCIDENEWTTSPPQCQEINECVSNPCGANANCTDKLNGYDCTCRAGFTGDPYKECISLIECETASDCGVKTECVANKCQCLNTSVEAFAGDAKDPAKGCIDKNECEGTNGCDTESTTCLDQDPGYKCECKDEYRRSNDTMKCDKIQCPKPDSTTFNTTIHSDNKAVYNLKDSILYECVNTDYEIASGNKMIKCTKGPNDQGQWDVDPLQCDLIQPCDPNPCGTNCRCQAVKGSGAPTFQCVCKEGWTSLAVVQDNTGPIGTSMSCDLCDAGYWNDNGNCTKCPVGTYKTTAGDGPCTLCPTERTTVTTGSTAESDCRCKPGFFEPVGSPGAECQPCEPGTYYPDVGAVGACEGCLGINVTSPSGSISQDNCTCDEGMGNQGTNENMTCGECNPGFYLSGEICVSCGENTISLKPRLNKSDCACKAGYAGTPCTPCGEGKYRGSTDPDTECLVCSTGPGVTTSSNTSTSSDQCQCIPGYAGDPPAQNCSICLVGYFSLIGSQPACSKCADGSTTSGVGSTSYSDCTCLAGYYGKPSVTGGCTECPEGTWSAANTALYANECTDCGQFTTTPNNTGGTSISSCYCIAGYAGNPNTNGGSCTICPDGEWSTTGQENCTSCGSNTMTTTEGGATNSSDCHCKDGYEGSPGTCTICPDGTYSASPGDPCTACPGDNTTTGGEGATSKSQCQCIAGYVGDPANDNQCAPCADGQWSTVGTTTSCNVCGAGKTTGGAGMGTSADSCTCQGGYATVGTDCVQCAENQYALPGATNCTQCPDNTQSAAGSSALADCTCPAGHYWDNTQSDPLCLECPVNTFSNETNAPFCLNCTGGTTTNGATGQTACGCNPGKYLDAGTCKDCPLGTYKRVNGDELSLCLNCTAGATTLTTGSTTSGDCLCEPGYGYGGASCSPCADGTYKDTVSNDNCTPAPNNSTVNANRTAFECDAGFMQNGTTCEQCAAGSYASAGSTSCTPCGQDQSMTTVGVATDNSSCVCAAGYEGDASLLTCTQCNNTAYKPNPGDGACTPVPPNSSADTTDNTFIICDPGYYTNSTKADANPTCEPCPAGTYKSKSGNDYTLCVSCGTTTSTNTGSTSESGCTSAR